MIYEQKVEKIDTTKICYQREPTIIPVEEILFMEQMIRCQKFRMK